MDRQPWITERQLKILGLHDNGVPVSEIAKELRLPWTTAYRTIKKYRGMTNINPTRDHRKDK